MVIHNLEPDDTAPPPLPPPALLSPSSSSPSSPKSAMNGKPAGHVQAAVTTRKSLKRKQPEENDEDEDMDEDDEASMGDEKPVEDAVDTKPLLPPAAASASALLPSCTVDEYEAGRVTCEVCGGAVSFRDDATQGFTLRHWEAHRVSCPAAKRPTGPPVLFSAASSNNNSSNGAHHRGDGLASPSISTHISHHLSALTSPTTHTNSTALLHAHAPPALTQQKRRRAKRTEEERIAYLRSDPYVGQFEAYRVLCASCDKWIRLRPNSTYCSIPWDAHRKSCLAKKINNKNAYALDERTTLFSKDPDVRKFDPERLLCNLCDRWLALPPDDHLAAVQKWLAHRAECQRASGVSASAAVDERGAGGQVMTYEHLDPAAGSASASHQHQQQAPPSTPSSRTPFSGTTPLSPNPAHLRPSSSSATHPAPLSPASASISLTSACASAAPALTSPFHSLTPHTYAPAHESRRRNAEQRAATLRADPLIGVVEENRVFCGLCEKWVQLRQDSSFCAYPWLQHRGKCLARSHRRTQKAAEMAEMKARTGKGQHPHQLQHQQHPQRHPAAQHPDHPSAHPYSSSAAQREHYSRQAHHLQAHHSQAHPRGGRHGLPPLSDEDEDELMSASDHEEDREEDPDMSVDADEDDDEEDGGAGAGGAGAKAEENGDEDANAAEDAEAEVVGEAKAKATLNAAKRRRLDERGGAATSTSGRALTMNTARRERDQDEARHRARHQQQQQGHQGPHPSSFPNGHHHKAHHPAYTSNAHGQHHPPSQYTYTHRAPRGGPYTRHPHGLPAPPSAGAGKSMSHAVSSGAYRDDARHGARASGRHRSSSSAHHANHAAHHHRTQHSPYDSPYTNHSNNAGGGAYVGIDADAEGDADADAEGEAMDADAEGDIIMDEEDDDLDAPDRGGGGGSSLGGGGPGASVKRVSMHASGMARGVPRRAHPVGLADLDSPSGRKSFIASSITHLFRTSFEQTDDMTVSALLAYLNAAIPQDKHEDFDTAEVARALSAMKERGRIVFEGDVLRLV